MELDSDRESSAQSRLPLRAAAGSSSTQVVRIARGLVLGLALSAPAAGFEPLPSFGRSAMVVTAERHATQIGIDVLKKGGNAVDASVAIGLALAVTEPNAGNLGGGGFMLVRMADGRTNFIDFREIAPSSASRDMYVNDQGEATDQSWVGYRASGVPGTVRGLALALGKYGTKSWESLVEPAHRLASDGFAVTWDLARSLRSSERLPLFPESFRIFLREGRPPGQGEVLRQPELASTLQRLRHRGPEDFYTGETARMIAADMREHGGTITLEDLRSYVPVERAPVTGTYRGHAIVSAPPPSSGGAGVVQILNILEGFDLAALGPGSASSIHLVAEAMRRFFSDRARYFGDTDFVSIPLDGLLSKPYASQRRASIDSKRATPSAQLAEGNPGAHESDETTHYAVVDEQGNAVAVTYTLNGGYGSGVTARGTGVLLNNEMDDFTAKPGSPNAYGLLQSENNSIEPGKRPLSAMSPTMVLREGQLRLVLGAQGGPTIISSVTQVLLDVVDFGMNVQQAVDFPRFHHQWMPDLLYMEPVGFSADTRERLEGMGHRLSFGRRLGHIEAIEVHADTLAGAADSRSEGVAAGL